MARLSLALSLVLLTGSCSGSSSGAQPDQRAHLIRVERLAREHPTFDRFWTRGLAELSRYALRQGRYGSLHQGEAVLIFVTEPFLPGPQVKDDGSDDPGSVQVLKLNAYRRFYTGIYPYTVLTSTFTPTAATDAAPFKVSTSVQEWCGHVYAQLNRRDDGYHLTSHSYFQAEADQEHDVPDAILEDVLPTRIRRDPDSLPTGTKEVVPAMHFLRFAHLPVAPHRATLTLSEPGSVDDLGTVRTYTIAYADLGRTVRYYFEPDFPFAIVGWDEVDRRGGGEPIVTTARLTRAGMLDYWNHHDPDDAYLRRELDLSL